MWLGGLTVLGVTATLLGPIGTGVIEAATPTDSHKVWSPPGTKLPRTASVPVQNAARPTAPKLHYQVPGAWGGVAGAPAPSAGTATVAVPGKGRPSAHASQSPVWIGSAPSGAKAARATGLAAPAAPAASGTPVAVRTVSGSTAKAAGLAGPVVSLTRGSAGPAGLVEVGLDVSSLDAAYGGDAASRARLVTLPACALTTPAAAGCGKETPVPSHVDPATERLVADVRIPATTTQAAAGSVVIAADPAPAGGGGTYAATSLNPSNAWTAGSSSGGFGYSYPIQVPPAIGGDAPKVSLDYNSSSLDGLTSSTNSQASWIGDGWDYSPGYVERSYKSCDKDGISHSGDLCWGGYNATLSLNGTSAELVQDDTSGAWRLKNDDGSKVEFLSGASNGAHAGEYVKVSTSSGSIYYFGANHLPGGDNSDPATNSAWTEPVYAPKSGDPCYDSAKGDESWCQMAWRFNLDYAVDPNGNLTTYTYSTESNSYQRGGGQHENGGTLTSYIRGGALTSISYGQRLADQITAKGTLKAAAKVVFTPRAEGRCSTDGGFTCDGATLASGNASHWPDVPYDQNCASSGTCHNVGPSFWSNIRLKSITTQVLSNGAYKDVDTYDLTQSFQDPHDGTKPSLWLASIQRTGKDGTPNLQLPKVTFTPVELPNRVDGTDLVPAPGIFNRPRIQELTTETGEQIQVDYSLPACSRVNHVMPADPSTDTMACYNVLWSPPGSVYGADPASDWFNRYQVASVTENDPVAHSPAQVTTYTYGPAAWHYNDEEMADPKSRTWDQFRGYASVTAVTGSGQDGPQSQTVTKYLQGMDGDRTASGGTKPVKVTDTLGDQITDTEWLSGQTLETDTYDKAGGSVTAYTVTVGSSPVTTATHSRGADLPKLLAGYASTRSVVTSKAKKADGSWETTTTTTVTDSGHANRTASVETQAAGQPDSCVLTSYATSSNTLLATLPDEVRTISGTSACTAKPTATNTVSDLRTLYDSLAFGSASGTGAPTTAQEIDHYDASGNAVFSTKGTTAYDAYGRAVSTTDPNATDTQHPNGATTTTTYAPAHTGELPSTITVAHAAPGSTTDWSITTTVDIARNLELTSTDINNKVTTEAYDSLGRLTKLWYPGRTSSQNPSVTYGYAVNGSAAPSAVTTSTLTSDTPRYLVSVEIFDGLGRSRQTQSTPGISAYHGRVLTDTFYDSQGRTAGARSPYYDNDAPPGSTLATAKEDDQVPEQTTTEYDGQGRPTAQITSSYAVEQWRTTTAYPGVDETDVTPPAGGTPTTTITDSLNRTSQVWQYKTATPTRNAADADVTAYTYTPSGKPLTRTDSTAKDTWSYGYDLHGRTISATDPDTGTLTSAYDSDGRLKSTTDARKVTLSFDYDLTGRKTAEYSTTAPSTTKVPMAAWTYDSIANAKGQPVTSTSYLAGDTAHPYTSAITGYDADYHATGTTVTIPSTEGGLARAYTSQSAYDPITGAITASHTDARGGLPAETVNYKYDVNGPLITFGSAQTTYDLSTDYDAYGRAIRTTVNPWGTEVVATDNYDEATGALLSTWVDKQTATSGAVQQTTYLRNPAGQLTAIKNIPDNTPAQTDLQCFSYDYLDRVTTAWTDTGGTTVKPQPQVPGIGSCMNSTPTSGAAAGRTTVGGPAPYWTSYGYDSRGDRTGLTRHDITGDTAKDVVTTQVFPPAGTQNTPTTAANTGGGTGGAHALLSTTSTGPNNPGAQSFQYDADGNTTAVTGTPGTTTLAWTPDGKLASLDATGTSGDSSYVYDAEGNQLVRHDPGHATLNLGFDELTLDTATGAVTDARSYTLPDGLTGVLQPSGLTWQSADLNGTATLALDSTTLAETRRPSDPFGQPRGTQPTVWAGDHGFVGGTADDATGLTNLGAREYQPATGRFLSPDPILDAAQPQQWNGYSYADNDPVNLSDPAGTDPPGTQNTCAYDLSYCTPKQCEGVRGVPCGHQGKVTVGGPKGPGLTVGTYDDGQPTLDTVRVPTRKELAARYIARDTDSYASLIGKWIQQECGGSNDSVPVMIKFCDDAASSGLLPKAGDDPFGIKDTVHCVTKGKDCGWAAVGVASDLLMFVPGVGEEADGAKVAARGAGTGAEVAVKDIGSGLEELAKSVCSVDSFPAETPVLRADGGAGPISEVKVGDTVLATDPLTGKTAPEKVVAVITTLTDTDFTDITVGADTGKGTPHALTSTQHHPYWDATRERWVNAADLHVGDALRLPDGHTTTVATVRNYTARIVTYNLTVEDLHTYYVLAGGIPVLVHNDRCLIGNLVGPKGEKLWLPKGRKAIATANNLKGWIFDVKPSEALANGFHKTVRYVRVMDPVTGGPHPYPNGYVSYLNDGGQIINPITGQTLTKADPYWHIAIP
nr:polymorphic toxin-type HINT domain-containing protein [Streptomyces sp. NBC_00899]